MSINNKPPLFNKYIILLQEKIYSTAENVNVKEKGFKELKETLLEKKNHKSLIELSILKLKNNILKF